MTFLFLLSVLFSFFFCAFCFLECDYLLSCFYLGLGVVFFCPLISLGLGFWYSYFVLLTYLTGVLALLTYICSLSFFNGCFNKYFYLLGFVFFLCFFYFGDFIVFDSNVSVADKFFIFSSYNYIFVFWIVFSLILLLLLFSYAINIKGCLRSF